MRWVIVNMKDYLFADAVTQSLRADKDSDFKVEKVYTPAEIAKYGKIASIVLMEASGVSPYTVEERLETRNTLKAADPNCKVVLVVDENSEPDVALEVRRAKKNGLIDQFIYGSISAGYLVALLDTL